MRSIAVVITARASYARIRTALLALNERSDVDLAIVLAASAIVDRFGDLRDQVRIDGFEDPFVVETLVDGGTPSAMAKTLGLGVIELSSTFATLNPDLVVTIADRFETLATAVAASYLNIPLAHVQGGEITGSIDEKVRHAVTKLADLHLPSTDNAARRLRRMGERAEAIVVTGCPSIDVAHEAASAPGDAAEILAKHGGVGAELDLSLPYLVAMLHPVTHDWQLAGAEADCIARSLQRTGMQAVWLWPNSDAGTELTAGAMRRARERGAVPAVRFFKNMPVLDFLRVLLGSSVLVGNSSVGIRECSYLGVPVVNVGSRQSNRDRAENVLDVGFSEDDIVRAIESQVAHGHFKASDLYGDGFAGPRIAEALATMKLTTAKTFIDGVD